MTKMMLTKMMYIPFSKLGVLLKDSLVLIPLNFLTKKKRISKWCHEEGSNARLLGNGIPKATQLKITSEETIIAIESDGKENLQGKATLRCSLKRGNCCANIFVKKITKKLLFDSIESTFIYFCKK